METYQKTEKGYLAALALVNTDQQIDYDTIQKNGIILGITTSAEAALTSKTVKAKDNPILNLDTSSIENKESGYQQIIEYLQKGHKIAKVSVVFNKQPMESKSHYSQPYGEIINNLIDDVRGAVYGYNFSDEKSIAWWTQELELDQVHELYKNDLVINLILHTD